jgi:predicted secreted protein
MFCRVVKQMLTDVSEARTASSIALIMQAVHTSETSVNIYLTTRQYNPEDSELHNRRRENLKSHIAIKMYGMRKEFGKKT